ncbi:MAG: PilZ domain-containing protein [Pseudomonadota bacterium]
MTIKTIDVKFFDIKEFLVEYSDNISKGGIYVKTQKPLEIKTKVNINIYLPEREDPIAFEGIVVNAMTPENAKKAKKSPGMGIKFDPFDEEKEALFFSYLQKLT